VSDPGSTVHRITCAVARNHGRAMMERLSEMGVGSVLVESGRSVRRRRYSRFFGLLGYAERLEDSPIELCQFSVAPEASEPLVRGLAGALEMNLPGRGTIYAQECSSFVDTTVAHVAPSPEAGSRLPGLLRDLAIMTCITSMSGSGEELARLALEFGTGVPMVTLGSGSGLRDRLGLLRITVPAEKEVVRLLVPALDAEGLMRMLIEKGRLNRPGKGFIYCSPLLNGLLDTRTLVGPQQHAATMEQIVAAIDELEKSTAWRRRFPELEPEAGFQLRERCAEITLVCIEEMASRYVQAAMQAGAEAATIAHLQRVSFGEPGGGARERCRIIVSQWQSAQVLDALRQAHQDSPAQEERLESLEVQPVVLSYSYRTQTARLLRRHHVPD